MAHWLLKTEPATYSFQDLQKDKKTTWDGVANALALQHIRAMKKGDTAIIYHSADQRAAVGLAKVASDPYADKSNPKAAVVDVALDRPLTHPVTLAQIKADPRFADFALVRISRLSVMPVSPEQWQAILKMSQSPA